MITRSSWRDWFGFSKRNTTSRSWALRANGIEALRVVRQVLPDVLVLDLRMPRKDGIEVMREFGHDGFQHIEYGLIDRDVHDLPLSAGTQTRDERQ